MAMTIHNKTTWLPSMANKIMDKIMQIMTSPAGIIEWLYWRFRKVNYCKVNKTSIVIHDNRYSFREIHADEIIRWSVIHEMGFDIVYIELSTGESLKRFDKYNDLLDGLRTIAKSKEKDILPTE